MDISLQFPTAKASCLTPHHGVIFYNFAGRARPIAIRFQNGEEEEEDIIVPLKGCPIPTLSVASFQSYFNNNGNTGGDVGNGIWCSTSALTSSILQNVFDYHLHRLASSKSSSEESKVVDGGGGGRQFVDQLQGQTSLLATMECQDCRPPPSPTAASVRRQHTSPHRQHGDDGCSTTISLFRPFADQEKLGHMATLDELNAFISRKLGTTREISHSSENKQKEVDAIALIESACATRSKAALRKGVVSKGGHYNPSEGEATASAVGDGEAPLVAPVDGEGGNNSVTTTVESLIYHTSPFSYCRADEIAFHTSVTPSSTDGANSLSNAVHIRGHYIPMSVFDAAHLYKYCVLARSSERSRQHQQHTSAHNSTSAQQYFVHNEVEPSTPLQALQCAYSFATRKLCPIEIHIDSLSGTRLWTGGDHESSAQAKGRGRTSPSPASGGASTKLVKRTPSSSALLPISHPPPSIPAASSKTRVASRSSRPSSTASQRLRHHPLLAALSIGRVVDHIDFTILQAEPNERLRIENEQGKCLEIIFFEFSKSAHGIISNERTIRAITGLQGSRYKRRFYKDFTNTPTASPTSEAESEKQQPPATSTDTGENSSSTPADVPPKAATVVTVPKMAVPTATTANGLISALSFGGKRKTPKRQPTPQELRERHRQRQLKAKTHTL